MHSKKDLDVYEYNCILGIQHLEFPGSTSTFGQEKFMCEQSKILPSAGPYFLSLFRNYEGLKTYCIYGYGVLITPNTVKKFL